MCHQNRELWKTVAGRPAAERQRYLIYLSSADNFVQGVASNRDRNHPSIPRPSILLRTLKGRGHHSVNWVCSRCAISTYVLVKLSPPSLIQRCTLPACRQQFQRCTVCLLTSLQWHIQEASTLKKWCSYRLSWAFLHMRGN